MNEDIGHFPPSAKVYDLFEYSREQHPKIFRALNSGRYINPKMKEKLEKRMYHCKNVMRHIASHDRQTYTINIVPLNHKGYTAEDFLNTWAACRQKLITRVELTPPI